MTGTEKWLFVVNPKAGRKRGIDLHKLIREELASRIPYDIIVWEQPDHFSDIGKAIESGNFSHVVAVGGDGTVNRVGATLLGKNTVLGLLPLGSGNGLARTLGFSMDPKTALRELLARNENRIDVATINSRPFFCTAGVGFDAHIGGLFAQSEGRGLRSYIRIVMRELFRYRAQSYRITVDGRTSDERAFLVTIANAGQYGNDFFIAPEASIQDGKLQVVILKPFNLLKAPDLLRKILTKKAHLSPGIITLSGSSIRIEREQQGLIHFDGEPVTEENILEISVLPGALPALTGPRFPVLQAASGSARAR